MKKLPVPAKKKRPADPNMRAHSIIQDVEAMGRKPVAAPSKRKKQG